MFFSNLKIYLIVAAVTLALGVATNTVTAWKFYHRGEAAAEARCDKEKQISLERKIYVREKQDEIRNHEPDNAVTVRRMFSHSF